MTPDLDALIAWHEAMAAEPKRAESKRVRHKATTEALRSQQAEIARLMAEIARLNRVIDTFPAHNKLRADLAAALAVMRDVYEVMRVGLFHQDHDEVLLRASHFLAAHPAAQDQAVRVCPIKDIVCSTPRVCESFPSGCKMDYPAAQAKEE